VARCTGATGGGELSRPAKPSIISIVMGSDSDLPTFAPCLELLKAFGVAYEVRVLSAHRTPDAVRTYITGAPQRGVRVIIAGAGGAAHLAGVLAAHTILPVLGVPMESAQLKGIDSLLSTVQMPRGVAVGTLAIGKPGAANAALLAVQILALSHAPLQKQLTQFKKQQASTVLAKDRRVRKIGK
jgi:phosphoribosylaminoimidazole carboxylase PurE protein